MKKIFEPIRVNHLTLKNRLVVSAMLTNLVNEDGAATEAYIAYHEAKAKGGWGLIITEDYPINSDAGVIKTLPRINSKELAESHSYLAKRVHETNGKIFIQLYHAGAAASSKITGKQPVAPSSASNSKKDEFIHELSKEEIVSIVDQFAISAAYVKEAGFDGVEIHGASGYLIGEFLSPFSNKRNDEYGGTIRGRTKFATDIVKAIRKKVGPDFPISFRLCTVEYVEGGLNIEESKVIARLLEEAGVDMLHCTQGINESRYVITPPYAIPRANFVNNAAEIKKVVSIPVIAVGGINDIDLAESILISDKADMVTMARASLADPDLPNKAKKGDFDSIIQCIGCVQGCQGENFKGNHIHCLVNPCTAMETVYDLERTHQPKKVWIIGGGIAGCYAAIAAARKGHKVFLFEKKENIGGQWNLAAVPLGKSGFSSLIRWQREEMKKLGINVLLNHEVDKEEIERAEPEVLIIATGSSPFIPFLNGVDVGIESGSVVTAHDVLEGKVLVKGNVAIVGGGLVGAETAEWLATNNCNVTLIEMQGEIVKDGFGTPKELLCNSLKDHGVRIMTNTKVLAVNNNSLELENYNEKICLENIDKIVMATGVQSNRNLLDSLSNYPGVVYCVGDARCTKNGYQNIKEAFELGLMV